ncbi:thermonuclease family protein [Rhodovarius crocodyli]|uniref:Thermonuclease family protein n=1 Tax=Rhodovarius crocodyli TaxID=1979269 RepID=A0A437M1W6_9PROT|nr:thermonuclease family protein [Rhodovarius crocodyli]
MSARSNRAVCCCNSIKGLDYPGSPPLVTPAAAERVTVVDGDTLRMGSERVRVMGLDAPEMHGQCQREEALARRAKARLGQLVAGGVRLSAHGRDRYGRFLAPVTDRQGRDVAHVLIREGLARAYDGSGLRGGWCH